MCWLKCKQGRQTVARGKHQNNLQKSLIPYFFTSTAKDILFVFGGLSSGVILSDVEALSLSPSGKECASIASLPFAINEFTAATLDGYPVKCGGYKG